MQKPTLMVTAIVVLVQTVVATGCGPSTHSSPHAGHRSTAPQVAARGRVEDLAGTLFTSRPVVVTLGMNWEPRDPVPGAVFKGFATLTCLVTLAVSEPLLVTLEPGPGSAPLTAVWDGQPVDLETSWFSRKLRVWVGPDRLQPGLHLLELHAGAGSERPTVEFDRVTARIGSQILPLDPRDMAACYLNSFLAHGVTGCSENKLGGFVFDGPQEQGLRVVTRRVGELVGVAENSGHQPARFRVDIGDQRHERELAPHTQFPFRLPVPAGEVDVRFAVEGGPGYYLWGAPHLLETEALSPPPILLVTLDTTRRDALSPYGALPELTPTIDRFSQRATVFTHAVTTAPWTLPAHVSLFTGLYPSHHHVGVTRDRIAPGTTTLAELLRRRGYVTAGLAGGTLCSFRFGLSLGFDHYRNPDGFETTAEPLTDRALDFVRAHVFQPFFLFVNYFDPHQPYAAPADVQQRLGVTSRATSIAARAGWRDLVAGVPTAWSALAAGELEPCPEGLDYLRTSYHAEVAHMDQQLGRLLDELQRLGVFDRALVILVGDHGELLGERGLYSHSYRLDPELTEVPLLVKWPGQASGQRRDELVSMVDLFPTVLSAAGVSPPPCDGEAVTNPTSSPRRSAVTEEHACGVHPLPPPLRVADHLWGLREEDRSRVVWKDGGEQWCEGPAGWQHCAFDLDRGEVEAVIGGILGARLDASGEDASQLTTADRSALEALGYLQPSPVTP